MSKYIEIDGQHYRLLKIGEPNKPGDGFLCSISGLVQPWTGLTLGECVEFPDEYRPIPREERALRECITRWQTGNLIESDLITFDGSTVKDPYAEIERLRKALREFVSPCGRKRAREALKE